MRTINATDGIRITSTRSTTATLLSKVLWITTLAFVFTALGAYMAPAVLPGVSFFMIVLMNFGLIFAINATRRSPALSLTLFYAFAILMGVEIGPLLQAYLHFPGGQAAVFNAAITTAAGMGIMGIVAQFARFDYRKVAGIASMALLGLIVVGLISMFVHFINPGLYAWLMLAVFSVLLLVDFMRLRDGGLGASPVQLALSIYLDALNIFLVLLQLFGNGGGRRDSR